MRRAAGILLVFLLGFGASALLLRHASFWGSADDSVARRNALAILDRPAPATPEPDGPMIRAAARIEPAVVNIDTLVTGQARSYDFFGNEYSRPYALEGKGSGVIITPDGYIITNNHVIAGANIIKVTLPSRQQYEGRVIGADEDADIAVVKIDGRNLPAAELGDSSKLRVGEVVLAIGYPLGLGTTVTHGIISATDRRDLEISEGHRLRLAVQTDAPINRGNSGGALANLNGQLVGINTAIVSENRGGSIGIGFAIPINAAKGVVRRIISNSRPQPRSAEQPFIGIQYSPVDPDTAAQLNLPPGNGVQVEGVVPLTAAAQAGLAPGDILVAIDGHAITGTQDVRSYLGRKRVGDRVTLDVVRANGVRARLTIKLGPKPSGFGR